jgi:hypothetical protein
MPYAGVAVVVLLLAIIFFFAPVPDIKAEDDYHISDKSETVDVSVQTERQVARISSYFLLWFNTIVLVGVIGMITYLILSMFKLGPALVDLLASVPLPDGITVTEDNSLVIFLAVVGCVISLILAVVLIPLMAKMSHHSIWTHPHFSGATLAQFFYVAAQAGIFSFVINYVVWEVPPLPEFLRPEPAAVATQPVADASANPGQDGAVAEATGPAPKESLIEIKTRLDKASIADLNGLIAKLKQPANPVAEFIKGRLSPETLAAINAYDGTGSDHAARFGLAQDLETVVTQDMRPVKKDEPPVETLYSDARFSGVALKEETRTLLETNPRGNDRLRLNRMLLADAFPKELPFQDGILCFSNRAASFLATLGFIFFLTGRFTGAGLLRKVSAHKIVGLYGFLNVIMCLLVFLKLGWISVIAVFLSYFFMSIMFPTIFALGIFGLGERAKGAAAFIVMAIMGGAMLPKVMGAVADHYDMSRSFVVPMACFVLIMLYGYGWPLLSKADSLTGVKAGGGH